MKSGVFAVAGQIGSGKSSVAEFLGALTGAAVTSFSRVLVDLAISNKLTPSRDVLQQLGAETAEKAPEMLCHKVLEQANWTGNDLVIDGLRHRTIAEKLRTFVAPKRLWIVYVEANVGLRRARVMAETGIDALPRWDAQPSELFLPELRRCADVVLTNEDSLDQLRFRVSYWISDQE